GRTIPPLVEPSAHLQWPAWNAMSKPLRLTAATLAIAALAPATASAAWTAPTTIDDAIGSNPLAQSAFGGSVLTGWLEPTASLAKRSGDAFGAPTALTAAD